MCPQFCCCYYLQSSSTFKISNKIDKSLSLRWKHHFRRQHKQIERQPYVLCRKSSPSSSSRSIWHNTRIIICLLSNILISLFFFHLVVANDELQIPTPSSSMSTNVSTTTTTTTKLAPIIITTTGLPPTQNYTIRNLEPYTEYFVTLRVFNPKGDGPVATLAATTDEGGM